MSDSESSKCPVPDSVGEDGNMFDVDEERHLGSGHFGDVYLGTQRGTGKKVAVKLEHRSGSIAMREWEVMRCLQGDGAPRVYYTGEESGYYVMVMDLLGPTLQKLLETQAPHRRLSWDTVSVIGHKCVGLLKKLHSKGYVHGDVKPENFLMSYSENGNARDADPREGLYMIDLGLASRWRDLTRSSGHIAYGQRVDHFSGTVRYASINAHLGRWLSRRDDLESLGYTMLYLLLGSLPWQGYNVDDKNMVVCETKGRHTIDTLCGGCPEVMKYFFAYVRSLKFEETPDYDYLQMLCEPTGQQQLQRLLRIQEMGDEAKSPKRERLTWEETRDEKRRRKIVIPRSEKVHQWIVVSTSARNSLSPNKQCFTSHTSYQNLVQEVEKKWEIGMRVQVLNFSGNMWTCVLNMRNTGFLEQSLHYVQESEFPRSWVRDKWNSGWFVTQVAGNVDSWGVVCSKMTQSAKYRQQSYIVSSTFPTKWVSEKWQSDYQVTSVATQGGPINSNWCVVMSRGTNFSDQCIELDFGYPSQSIHARWNDNYMITSAACTHDQSAFVLSRGHVHGEEQRCTRTSYRPLDKIRDDWQDTLFVNCLGYGRVS